MSPSAASGRSETVTASWKALTIQIAFSGATANSRAIVGSATVTMVPSSTAMLIAMASVVNASRPLRVGEAVRGFGGAGADRFRAVQGDPPSPRVAARGRQAAVPHRS